MKKNVAVIIRHAPIRTIRNKESLRMCVGATLKDNVVTVIFLGPGVISGGKIQPTILDAPDLEQEFEAFSIMKIKLLAERGAIKRYKTDLRDGIETVDKIEIAKILAKSDVVIPW
ncbi:MAG: DsrE family protein [ANME-2 cluster archaeon]|nr:DsrE family protein [ANME-2 cluster archaeon]